MYTGDKSWAEINKVHRSISNAQKPFYDKKKRVLLAGAVLIALLCYTIASAMCATTGVSCPPFANGDLFSWIAGMILR